MLHTINRSDASAFYSMLLPYKKDLCRREGKGRPCFSYLIKFFAVLAILYQNDLKKGIHSFCSSYRPGAINPFLQIILVAYSAKYSLFYANYKKCVFKIHFETLQLIVERHGSEYKKIK